MLNKTDLCSGEQTADAKHLRDTLVSAAGLPTGEESHTSITSYNLLPVLKVLIMP